MAESVVDATGDGRSAEPPLVQAVGHDRYLVTSDGEQQLAHAVRSSRGVWVFLDGHVYFVDDVPERERARQRQHDLPGSLASPMPATVTAILVQPGQAVDEGDTLVMLEAMKMELPLKAPRQGRVRRVGCAVGELVQAGVPLIEFEES